MLKIAAVILLLSPCIFVSSTFAQTSSSSEKQAVIKELVVLINGDKKTDDLIKQLIPIMQEAQKSTLKKMLADDKNFTDAEKLSLENSVFKDSDSFTNKFKEKLVREINYSEIVNEITSEVYDKYYTLEELKDLKAFYQSPTGQKTLKIATPLSVDSFRLSQEKLGPKISIIIKETLDENTTEMQRKISAAKVSKAPQ